ncbi:hypothetical protein BDZ91DRAFT_110486 [Kalaharituber pfeilii]|nr:hypothetical protein BDZ91DRAFT_110486 [Kalaharituber pfeilii]
MTDFSIFRQSQRAYQQQHVDTFATLWTSDKENCEKRIGKFVSDVEQRFYLEYTNVRVGLPERTDPDSSVR